MSRFDRYMVHVDVGTDEKLAGLTDAERLCHVVGVLAIAAKSPIRGYLIVGDAEATPMHIGRRAAVSERTAKKTVEKLIAVGILVRDEEVGALRVHNWERFNPAPKTDGTSAERQARYRQRLREKGMSRSVSASTKDAVIARDEARCVRCGDEGDVEFHHRLAVVDGGSNEAENLELLCPTCHRGHASETSPSRRNARDGDTASLRASAIACARSPEGMEDEEGRTPPMPPKGGRARDRELYESDVKAYASWLLPDALTEHAVTAVRSALGSLGRRDGLTNDQVRRVAEQWLPDRVEVAS